MYRFDAEGSQHTTEFDRHAVSRQEIEQNMAHAHDLRAQALRQMLSAVKGKIMNMATPHNATQTHGVVPHAHFTHA